MSKDNSFNQNKYVQNYIKSHYTECKVRLKADISEKINSFCAARGISKNTLFTESALFIINHDIDISNKDKYIKAVGPDLLEVAAGAAGLSRSAFVAACVNYCLRAGVSAADLVAASEGAAGSSEGRRG